MSELIDQVIPKRVPIAKCAYCGKIVTGKDTYFDFNDFYDGFLENDDPDDGFIEEYISFRCPYCDEANDGQFYSGAKEFEIKKKSPPPKKGFALSGGFSLPSKTGFSLTAGRFSLSNLRRGRR